MTVLVDTTVWSLALRRRERDLAPRERLLVAEWAELVREGGAGLLGIVRQEVLSGILDADVARRLRDRLRAFPDLEVSTSDHEAAADHFNVCRAHGVQGSPVDFLLCAMALRLEVPLFTTDRDFTRYARILPLRLHDPRPGLTPWPPDGGRRPRRFPKRD